MSLDDELKAALRREDPSPGFASRVAARAQHSPTPKAAFPRRMWVAAIASMLAVGFAATFEYRQKKAERAGRDVVIALRIAAEKLNMARDKVTRREN